MVEGFGLVSFVADVSEDIAPGDSIRTAHDPRFCDITESFSDICGVRVRLRGDVPEV